MGQQIKRETKLQVDTFALIRFLSAIAIVLYHYNKLTGGMIPTLNCLGISYSS